MSKLCEIAYMQYTGKILHCGHPSEARYLDLVTR